MGAAGWLLATLITLAPVVGPGPADEPAQDPSAVDRRRAKAALQEFGRACRADVSQFCPRVEPGGGRLLDCLASHQPELSIPCQAQMTRISEARMKVALVTRSCRADVERLCRDVPPQAGPLLQCLEANASRLSGDCTASSARGAVAAAVLVDVIEDMARGERVREALEILQGLDSVAFSRSQVLLQFDSFQSLADRGNGGRLLFNPQFVFGDQGELALQVKVPVTGLFPYAAGAPAQFGLGAVTTAFGWNFLRGGGLRHYLALGLQWETASTPSIGGPWALVPSYAVGAALAGWISVTAQVVWFRSIGSQDRYPALNLLVVEPIVAANLPGRSFLALDTRLGWDFASGTFVPIVKGVAGLFTDRQKSLSVSAWYQAALTQPAASRFFQYGVGMGLAYFFDL